MWQNIYPRWKKGVSDLTKKNPLFRDAVSIADFHMPGSRKLGRDINIIANQYKAL